VSAASVARQALTLGPADAARRMSGGNVARPACAAPFERVAALGERSRPADSLANLGGARAGVPI